ncbi:MAG: GDP-mannose 4,6-dehydratase [Candidatus Magasanikbacteria bacterium]|nr:GDP-mannose 4,6-dehydratase [Candidatus Magasanikbacteria bacterium]
MKRALITGITGQDGAYLAKLLLEKGYKVYGMYRRSSTRNFWRLHYLGVKGEIELISGDLIDQTSIMQALIKAEPDEVYNLAAQSFVASSFEEPLATAEITGLGAMRILDCLRIFNPQIRFYQAGTSEMFGNTPEVPQKENTLMMPDSPYAAAKVFAYNIVRNYREGYGLFACTGILFNHESPIRGIEFVTKKITDGVARIKLGIIPGMYLGNLDTKRDWGFAGDYVKAMWLMLQQAAPMDYVIASGESHSVREFAEKAFAIAGLNWEQYVKVDQKFFRPRDIMELRGDSTRAQKELNWNPRETTFDQLIELMVKADFEKYQRPEAYMSYFLKHL